MFLLTIFSIFNRPPFEVLEVWLESLAMHISVGHKLPNDLKFDIDHYKGTQSRESSLSSTPDGLSTPTSRVKHSYVDDQQTDSSAEAATAIAFALANDSVSLVAQKDNNNVNHVSNKLGDAQMQLESITNDLNYSKAIPSNENNSDITTTTTAAIQLVDAKNAFIRDIPKSPHLSKDFSPNGDRIRDSVRARRQQRMQQNRENLRKSYDCSKNSIASEGTDTVGSTEVPCAMEKSMSEPVNLIVNCVPSVVDVDTAEILQAVKQTLELERRNLNSLAAPDRQRKPRPYGEKGFIINVNEGTLTLNNVKDLDNCSDFDSSCDTSLNYIDLNAPASVVVAAVMAGEPNSVDPKSDAAKWNTGLHKIEEKTNYQRNGNHLLNRQLNEIAIEPVVLPDDKPSAPHGVSKSYKSALEELKSKLNLCRNKLECLETAGKQTITNSRRSMRNYFKNIPLVHETGKPSPTSEFPSNTLGNDYPDAAVPMYSRNNPLSPLFNRKLATPTNGHLISEFSATPANTTTITSSTKPSSSKLFRINDTPIFERRNVRSMFGASLFRRSDSDENIPTKSVSYKATAEPQVHERTFSFKQKISPTSDLKPSYNFSGSGPIAQPSSVPISKKSYVLTSKPAVAVATPSVYTSTKYHHIKGSPACVTSAPVRTVRSQVNSEKHLNYANAMENSRSTSTKSTTTAKVPTRINLLSPERIHKLNAKLTESKTNNRSNGVSSAPVTSPYRYREVANTKPVRTVVTKSTLNGNQYQQNMVVHKFLDSPVRRTVNKFDRKTNRNGTAGEATLL